jgi:hypothetical protein
MSIILVTSANGPYMERMRPYLSDLQARLNGDIYAVCMAVDCAPPSWAGDVSRVAFMPMTAAENAGTSESTSVEHGSFLSLLPGDDDDVIIKTDGDLRMQRAFHPGEMDELYNFEDDVLAAAWNAGPGDTLGEEARRLRPRVDVDELARRFPNYENVPCGNGGVWIARRSAYQAMYEAYMARWVSARESFSHYARQQWLINYARMAAGLTFTEMSPAIHAQGHYGTPAGVTFEDGTAMYDGEPVVFRHKL